MAAVQAITGWGAGLTSRTCRRATRTSPITSTVAAMVSPTASPTQKPRAPIGGWSIQREPSQVDQRFWERQRIRILDVPLEDWVDAIVEQVEALRERPA